MYPGLGPHGTKPTASLPPPSLPPAPGARTLSPPQVLGTVSRPWAARTSCGRRGSRPTEHPSACPARLVCRPHPLSEGCLHPARLRPGGPQACAPAAGWAGSWGREQEPRLPGPSGTATTTAALGHGLPLPSPGLRGDWLCQEPCVWRRKRPCPSGRTRLALCPAPVRVPPRWGHAGGALTGEGGDRPAGPALCSPDPEPTVCPRTAHGAPGVPVRPCDPEPGTWGHIEGHGDQEGRETKTCKEKGNVHTAGWPRVSAPHVSAPRMSTRHEAHTRGHLPPAGGSGTTAGSSFLSFLLKKNNLY